MVARTARQTQIIEEALALIAEQGMQGLTYRNLSERFGISIPAFYRHFPCKADVLSGIIDYLNELHEAIYQEAQEKGTSPLERLRLVLMGYADRFSKNSALAAALFPDIIGEARTELHDRVLEHMGKNRKRLTALITDGVAEGSVRGDVSAERLALVVMATLRLEVTHWRLNEHKTDLVKRVAALWDDLEKILGCPQGNTAEKTAKDQNTRRVDKVSTRGGKG